MPDRDTGKLQVYWRPGCSSRIKVREFLSRPGVDYESVNVSAPPPENIVSVGHIRDYGRNIAERISAWRNARDDKSCQRPVAEDYAGLPMPAGLWE